MKLFFDTGIWLRWYAKLPLPKGLESFIKTEAITVCLSTCSIYEVVYKYKLGKLPIADPEEWLEESLEGIIDVPPTAEICRHAAAWEWENKDPFDRIIAASAVKEEAVLIHTDKGLRGLPGFSQKYFAL